MNRRDFLKILGVAPALATLPVIGSIPQVLQLYTPTSDQPLAVEGSNIITIPFRLALLQDGKEQLINMPMPCTIGPTSHGVGCFPVYNRLHFYIKSDLQLLYAEADASPFFERILGAPPRGYLCQCWNCYRH